MSQSSQFSRIPPTVIPDWLFDRWESEAKDNEEELERFHRHFIRATPTIHQESLDRINEFWRNR